MQNDGNQHKLSNLQMAMMVRKVREQLGGEHVDPEALAAKLESLERGLPAEKEFIALASWLGKCKLIHKFGDEEHYPLVSQGSYQVPDLLAVFEHEGRLVPTLVEVKAISKPKLSWTPDYLDRLRRYAELLNLPLLIAWKHRIRDMNLSFWTLFDANAFRKPHKNYQIEFVDAMNEDLLGVLAGDFGVEIRAGVGLHFDFFPLVNKAEWHKAYENRSDIIGKGLVFRVDGEGNKIDNDSSISPGLLAILECGLFCSKYFDSVTDSSIHFGWKVPTDQLVLAQHMFRMLLTGYGTEKGEIVWSDIVRRPDLPVSPAEIDEAADGNRNICRSILHRIPHSMPAFLG